MAATVWKFKVGPGLTEIAAPGLATVLSAGLDPQGDVCVWALVHPGHPEQRVTIGVVGTGHEIDSPGEDWKQKFVGTFVLGGFVGHVFEWKYEPF